jgi:hypothetical protein
MSGEDQYRVEVPDTLLARQAGTGALERARSIEASRPLAGILGRLGLGESGRWRKGAAGERRVGKTLAKLPKAEWAVLHDVPIGGRGANVDHLVIGPGGVFTLNTKNLTGKVWVAERVFLHNGHRTDYLPKAHREGERVARLLDAATGHPVTVTPVLVVMADEFVVKAQPSDVVVLRRRELVRWLRAQPRMLDHAAVLRVGAKAHRPETWTS